MAVLALAATAAVSVHDAGRRAYARGGDAAELQQSLRNAFDRLAADLRLAGYNVNPDGDPVRPDEAIEGAFDTAVAIRADFDADDPSAADTPEAALAAGGAFAAVSTGNDEIVTYALARPDGSGPDTIELHADLDSPRSGVPRRVGIARVALAPDEPPYTLYRITLSNGDGSPVRTPVAENVLSLRFVYRGQDGQPLPSPGGAETAEARASRGAVRRITVELVGLARDPDPDWSDTADPDPRTRSHRKFRLAGDVAPRTLGLEGRVDP